MGRFQAPQFEATPDDQGIRIVAICERGGPNFLPTYVASRLGFSVCGIDSRFPADVRYDERITKWA